METRSEECSGLHAMVSHAEIAEQVPNRHPIRRLFSLWAFGANASASRSADLPQTAISS
jgi:hypothetical protein